MTRVLADGKIPWVTLIPLARSSNGAGGGGGVASLLSRAKVSVF
jgi:hypothetical protein